MAPPPGPESIRQVGLYRSVVLNLAVLVLATLLLNAFLVWNLDSSNRWMQREQIALQSATLLAEQIEGTLLLRGGELGAATAPDIQLLLDDIAGGKLAPSALMVVDTAQVVIASTGSPPADELPPADLREAVVTDREATGMKRSEHSFWGPRELYASVPIHMGSLKIGGVRAAYPVGSAQTWLLDWKLLVFILYCAGAVVIVTLFSTAIFRNRILNPIRVLMVGTSRVAEGMFSIRVPEDEPNEIGELAVSFNQMAEELERYQARSEEHVRELQHINELLERTRDELAFQARMAGVGRLAAGVAHEIGNPLSAVMGMVDLLRDEDIDPDGSKDLLRRVSAELQRVHATVRDMLDYARPAQGEREPVDLEDVLRSAREMVSIQKEFEGIEIIVDVQKDMPAALAEPVRIRQVVLNLLLNARDALGGEGRVWIRSRYSGGRCLLLVSDDGPGVATEHADSIFDPFFTTKEPGEGTGLGLSVSLQIVESFGGNLRFRHRDEGGAEFIVDLPAVEH